MCLKKLNFEYLERATMSNIHKMLLNLSKLKMNVFTNSSKSNKKIQYLFVLVFAVFAPGHFYHFSCQDIFNIRQYYLLTFGS